MSKNSSKEGPSESKPWEAVGAQTPKSTPAYISWSSRSFRGWHFVLKLTQLKISVSMGNFGPGNLKFIILKVEVEHVFQTIAFLFTESTVGEVSL